MLDLEKSGDGIFFTREPIVCLGDEALLFLKQQAKASNRKRARICAHRSGKDALHEMLIAISADSYIHPHRHIDKSESFHIVEGFVDVVIFDDAGAVTDIVSLGALGSGRNFYYRLSESRFHTLLIHSEQLVVHEVTNGPFIKNQTELAPFAPREEDREAGLKYMKYLAREVLKYGRNAQQ